MSSDLSASDKKSTELVTRLWRDHVAKYWPILTLALILMSLEGAALGAFAWLVRPLFDELFAAQSMDGIGWVVAAIGAMFAFRAIAGFLHRIIIAGVGLRVTNALQVRLVKHILGLDSSFFAINPPGSLIERVRGDTMTLQSASTSVLLSLGRDSVALISLTIVMLLTDWSWTLVALVGVPLLILPMSALLRLIRRTAFAARDTAALLTTRLDEMFHGVQSIKVNRLEATETERFAKDTRRFLRFQLRSSAGQAANPSLIDLLSGLGFVAVTLFGAEAIINGEKTVGEFMSFITALSLMFDPLKRLSNTAGGLQAAAASLDRLYTALEVTPKITSPANPKPLTSGDIRFEAAEFAYGDAPVLRGLDLTALEGKTTAIVGPSGAGKTTVFGLLTRLIDPDTGKVTIGGTQINEVSLEDLRNSIAVVGQETALFDQTIAENIRMGRLDATDAEIHEAAAAAHILEFTDALPDGLETPVGPRGSSLSGGQRQRVAIARAMLKKAPILLLDEPTSALDTQSEKLVQEALARLSEGRTTLVIAHRLSTVREADLIVVMDHGRVVEQGTHDTLIAQDGAYARLNALQSAGIETSL